MKLCKLNFISGAVAGLLILAVLVAGCKKEENSSGNGWRMGYLNYGAKSVKEYASSVVATASNEEYLVFTFNSTPIMSGTYFITSESKLSGANDVAISFKGITSNSSYASTDHTTGRLTVHVADSIVSISVPEIWMYNSSIKDSLRFSCNIHETN